MASVVILAGAVRAAAAAGDLWFDELWSLLFARLVRERWVNLLALRHDNNHLLNTAILALWGDGVPGLCYRLPAVLASIGSIWLAGKIAARSGGPPAALVATILFGGSCLMVLYGSEARGYAYLVFFCLLAWESLQRLAERRHWRDALLFAVSAGLGFLSHLTFAYCYAGLATWTIRRLPWRIALLAHLPPLLIAGYLYLFFIGGLLIPPMAIGGGPETTLFGAVVSTLSLMLGGPLGGDGALLAAFAVLLLVAGGLVRIWQTDRPRGAAYAVIIFLAPAAVLAATGANFLYPRYFLVPAAFGLLVVSDAISFWPRLGAAGRIAQVAFLAVYLALNGWENVRLVNHGRGDYSRALMWMAAQSPDGVAAVSSDFDFRNQTLYDYFAPRLGLDGVRLRYVGHPALPPEGTDWLIRHNFEGDRPFPEFVNDGYGHAYRLERVFRHQSLSGWNWWVYRRVDPRRPSS